MHWRKLKDEQPASGTKCVVAYFPVGSKKATFGIFEFYGTYWENRYGKIVQCSPYNNWCYVDEIVKSIEQRFEDDVRSAIREYRINSGD